MKVLLVGGGGREHALAWKIRRDEPAAEVIAAPGNPGIAEIGRCVAVKPADPEGIVRLARGEEADLVVVGPEGPLAAGVVDALRAADADDRRHGAGGASGKRAGRADQADTDDRELFDSHALASHHRRGRSAVSSAARKRAFSAGKPTVTRSHDGRP